MKKSVHKINVRTIRKLGENDGLTIKNGKKNFLSFRLASCCAG